MESSRTTIGGNLLLEKSLYSKKVSSYNGSLQFLSGEAMKMASGKSAFILGKLCENKNKMQTQTFKFFVASNWTKTKYYLHATTNI